MRWRARAVCRRRTRMRSFRPTSWATVALWWHASSGVGSINLKTWARNAATSGSSALEGLLFPWASARVPVAGGERRRRQQEARQAHDAHFRHARSRVDGRRQAVAGKRPRRLAQRARRGIGAGARARIATQQHQDICQRKPPHRAGKARKPYAHNAANECCLGGGLPGPPNTPTQVRGKGTLKSLCRGTGRAPSGWAASSDDVITWSRSTLSCRRHASRQPWPRWTNGSAMPVRSCGPGQGRPQTGRGGVSALLSARRVRRRRAGHVRATGGRIAPRPAAATTQQRWAARQTGSRWESWRTRSPARRAPRSCRASSKTRAPGCATPSPPLNHQGGDTVQRPPDAAQSAGGGGPNAQCPGTAARC